jgi:hypothetical protein
MRPYVGAILLISIVGCSSQPAPDRLSAVERKLDQIISKLDAAPAGESPGSPAQQEPAPIDTSKLKRENTSDLAWLLVTKDPKEKAVLVRRRIQQSSSRKQILVTDVQAAIADLEGLSVVLNASEGLDLALLQEVEEARNRLVGLLRKDIPGIVTEMDKKAVATDNYAEARRLWAESSAVLGFYPASNDPEDAGRIQDMVSAHDLVRTRSELAQQQRYNLWACQQIRNAWKDFNENSDLGARMNTCLEFLGPIHTGLLDPVSLEFYRDFLQEIHNDKDARELYQHLAEKLAQHKRRTLADSQEENR